MKGCVWLCYRCAKVVSCSCCILKAEYCARVRDRREPRPESHNEERVNSSIFVSRVCLVKGVQCAFQLIIEEVLPGPSHG